MLAESQKSQFLEEGYLVIPDVVPKLLCDTVIDAITEYASIDLEDRSTWYRRDFDGHGIIPLHHHQALWNLRQHPGLHDVFSLLYGTRNLFVSNDRVSFKPPLAEETSSWRREPIHWDCDPWTFKGLGMQGLVYLSDTDANQGAFACVPSIYQNLSQYLSDHKDDEHRRFPQVKEDDLVRVPGTKGSLVVFHRLMPHTSDLNRADQHRFVQYVTMSPASETLRDRTIREWRERLLPDWALTQSVSGGKSRETGPPPELGPLGRKLVGLDYW